MKHAIWICLVCQAPQSAENSKAWRKGKIVTCDECKELSRLCQLKIPVGTLYTYDHELLSRTSR